MNEQLSAYPVQEWKEHNLQFVPHILISHLEIVLWVREVPTYLYNAEHTSQTKQHGLDITLQSLAK